VRRGDRWGAADAVGTGRVAEGESESAEVDDVGIIIDGEGAHSRVHELQLAGGVEYGWTRHFLRHRLDDLALAIGPADVPLWVLIAHPPEGEGGRPVDVVAAGGPGEFRFGVVDGEVGAEVDGPERVDDLRDPAHADLGVMVDLHPGEALHRRHE